MMRNSVSTRRKAARAHGAAMLALWLVLVPGSARAATYYIGAFSGSAPADTPDCGPGRGVAAGDRPCASLAYWTENRRAVLRAGDVVRLAPGTYGPSTSDYHCILADAAVTYEGRTGADAVLDDYTSVVIDLSANPTASSSNCQANGVRMLRAGASNFTVRDLKIQGARSSNSGSGAGIYLVPTSKVANILVDRVWVHDNDRQGILVAQPHWTGSDCDGGAQRMVGSLVIRDSKATSNRGVFGGIAIGCADDVLVERNQVRDNRGPVAIETCQQNPEHAECNDHDGIQCAGCTNFTIRDNIVSGNGQDGIGIGGHYRQTHDGIVERNIVYENGNRQMGKISGGAYNIVERNNIAWGPRMIQSVEACTNDIKVYNNTFYRTAGSGEVWRMWHYCKGCEIRNNIFLASGSGPVVMTSYGSTAPDVTWRNNVVHNYGSGPAIIEDAGDFLGQGCAHPACNCGGACAQVDWCPLDFRPGPQADAVVSNSPDGLGAFRAQGDAGQWFGAESGDTDRGYGVAPQFVAAEPLSAVSLHLRANDAIARDGAERIAGFADDVDGQTRGAAWDVGADEFIAACGLDSQCDDGVACTDDRCVAGNCLNADTCGAGQSCSVESDRCEQVPGTGQPGVPPVPKIVTVDPLRSR